MRLTSRIKKLEDHSGVGFVVVVPEIEYLGVDCTGAEARLEDGVVYMADRERDEDIATFKRRFVAEYKEVCHERLSNAAKTVIVLGDEVRDL
ncbi:hypothetical protein AAFO92_19330 [Roseovarius sp. CAU 1744]|uniref:hypothetical protein n=1 Tax=Roseovarius sp. CAU 1744 TaxID=3140368 RepID=UPI00325B5EB3